MYWHIVYKHIRCIPCKNFIQVRKFRTTQGADTPEDKALQDRRIENRINNHQLLGFPICPKCKKKAAITDPPIVLYNEEGNAHRDESGNVISRYADQIDMATIKWDRYGHAVVTNPS